MSDEIDRAQDAEAVNIADALERTKLAALRVPRLVSTGECHNPRCGEPFAANDNRLFCDAACATEHGRFTRK